jgi:hypothetical protein
MLAENNLGSLMSDLLVVVEGFPICAAGVLRIRLGLLYMPTVPSEM